MRVIIAGSRSIVEYEKICKAVENSKFDIDTVIAGGASGVDKLAENWANDNNKSLIVMNADWEAYGKSAGYRRNADMAATADALIAVWDGKSRGTMHMINIAKKKGLKVYVTISK